MTSVARNSLAPGTRFGRYEIVADIASGGMAMVYLGRALGAAGFQRLVAIKLMHAQYANDDDFVGMFMDEARLAARIRHPNVVATLDLENDEDGLYLVMEYIEGDTLLSMLRGAVKQQRRIPPSITLRIVLDMLNGLHAAHELTGDNGEPLRLVHRDISPHNVLVGLDGISRITDFGIARAEARMTSTKDGKVKGKLAYMAPEQTAAGPIDRRCDLFATGVVLWESLAGRRLFAGQSDAEILRNLLVNPIPRPREFVPELPETLEAVCMCALDRDPDQRYATAAQMADALEQAGGSIGIASNRAVAQFVREVCGDRIAAIQQRARGVLVNETGQYKAATVRRRENTDPERTTQRPEIAVASTAPMPVSAVDPMGLTPMSASDVGTYQPRSKREGNAIAGWLVGALVVAAGIAGGGYWWSRTQSGPPTAGNAAPRVTPERSHTPDSLQMPVAQNPAPSADAGVADASAAEVPPAASNDAGAAPTAARDDNANSRAHHVGTHTHRTPNNTTTTNTDSAPATNTNSGQTTPSRPSGPFNPESM